MNTIHDLSDSRAGRVLLHALCTLQRPAHFLWHWRGILRELHRRRYAICYPTIGAVLMLAATLVSTASALAQGTYLSAPDGNPTNAVVVAPGGKVGFGTTTPEAKIEIRNDAAQEISALRLTESHPAISGDVIKLEFVGDSQDSGVEVLRELARIQAHNIQTDSHRGYLSFWTMHTTELQ
jgi:hypothetical protein